MKAIKTEEIIWLTKIDFSIDSECGKSSIRNFNGKYSLKYLSWICLSAHLKIRTGLKIKRYRTGSDTGWRLWEVPHGIKTGTEICKVFVE